MSVHYQKVPLNEDDDKETSDEPKITVTLPESQLNHVTISKGIFVLLCILIFCNMILAAGSVYYSYRMSQLLKKYEEKDLASLRRIDPFDGTYRSPAPSGERLC